MEDSNGISNNAIESRVKYLEKRVLGFRIAVTGSGLEGGFGVLPRADELSMKLANLEKSFSGFRLQGSNGVNASGSIEDGYILSG